MNIFGYSIVGTARYEAIKKDLLRNQAHVGDLTTDLATVRSTLENTKRELNQALNRLESAATREGDLERTVKELRTTIVAAQKGRLEHNDVLLSVGKSWVNFKKAWQFRKDNPKMAPKQRAENTQTLDDMIAAVDANLPKKIQDPIERAIEELGNPSPENIPSGKAGKVGY